MIRTACSLLVLSTIAMSLLAPAQARAEEPQLAHIVFFQLAEKSAANQKKLVAACNKYLSKHEGTVYYSAGVVADDHQREVNVTDFDVSLHVVFENKAAHDQYQTHPRHLKFIKENKQLWSGVRVFDSYIPAMKKK